MSTIFFSLIFVYLFIFLGYLSKKIFKNDINTKTLTLISVYFLQPFVVIWGFTTAPLQPHHIFVPLSYFSIVITLLIPTFFISKYLFSIEKERIIFTITGFIGNTGNIGIPLGIALFGIQSVLYTTLINIANVYIIYIIGAYLYSRGSFSIKQSLLNIIKIPIIPSSIIAILINIYQIPLSSELKEFFKMGAYSGIVMQLFLLGTFLQGIRITLLNPKLFIGVMSQKFIIIPLFSAFLLHFTPLSLMVQGIIVMEMITPLAIANINLASLYNCKPQEVTILILLSTLLFIPIIFALHTIINFYYL